MQPVWHFVNGVPQIGPLSVSASAVVSTVPVGIGGEPAAGQQLVVSGGSALFANAGKTITLHPNYGALSTNHTFLADSGMSFVFRASNGDAILSLSSSGLAVGAAATAGASGTFTSVTVVNGIVTAGT